VGLLVLFFDGVGVGTPDPETNVFARIGARRLAPVAGLAPEPGCAFRPVDATLGVPGLPQSATGQSSLLTGVNCARYAGRHLVGFPGPTLWPVLERESLFRKLVAAGRRPTSANAYSRQYFEAARPRWGATTRALMAARLRFRMWDEADALPHDYTGEWMQERGLAVPRRSAAQAAAVLTRLLAAHDLVWYEYFLTDLAAHRGTFADRIEQARRVEALVDAVLERADLGHDTVLVISDHGNLEEATHTRHTRNPVPLLVWGTGAAAFAGRVAALDDLTPAILAAA